MKQTRKFFAVLSVIIIVVAMTGMNAMAGMNNGWINLVGPKYIFYFIGDGMGSPQIHSAEAYLAQLAEGDEEPGSEKAVKLTMSTFPVQGMSTTAAYDRFITGSAAAGTALACGMKTNVGVISMDPDKTRPYRTLAEAAKDRGMKVGIITSVSIDHATPAVFYAHQPSRNNYHEIAMELANSDFDYFAGGGFKKDETGEDGAIAAAVANGFTYCSSREELDATHPGDRVIATNELLTGGSALPYAIDRQEGRFADNISLAEFTEKGIELLKNRKGFFMMVEGGKIDWANHANDARASIDDTIAFDDAIKVAVEFMERHPRQTLIVVTADHECGGMTLGFAGTKYDTHFELLAQQKKSYEMFNNDYFSDYKESASWGGIEDNITADLKTAIADYFGLIYDDGIDGNSNPYELTEYERKQLEDAYDRSMGGESIVGSQEDYRLYGHYEPFTVTITHLLNNKAGIAFTSYSHTGVPVPVLAAGRGATLFGGFYDNTDIAKRLAKVMHVSIGDM